MVIRSAESAPEAAVIRAIWSQAYPVGSKDREGYHIDMAGFHHPKMGCPVLLVGAHGVGLGAGSRSNAPPSTISLDQVVSKLLVDNGDHQPCPTILGMSQSNDSKVGKIDFDPGSHPLTKNLLHAG